MIARALLREFPEHADLFSIGALQLGNQYIPNHNGLLGRYPGADGMKTGFTCPAGFNVVASANHSGRRLIVVVLGAPTAKSRNQEAADLFDRGFAMNGGGGVARIAAFRLRRRRPTCAPTSACAATRPRSPPPKTRASPQPIQVGWRPRAAGFRSLTRSRRCSRPRTPSSRTKGSGFDPVRVFLGPAPGWKGPALGARPTGAATRSPTCSGRDRRRQRRATAHGVRCKAKPIRHAAAATKAQKLVAAKTVKPKAGSGDSDK